MSDSDSYIVLDTGLDVAPPDGAPLDPDYDVVIGDDPTTDGWWDADNLITLNGSTVSAVGNQKPGGPSLTQNTAQSQPAIASAFLDGRSAFIFQRGVGVLPKRLLYNSFPAAGATWSKLLLMQDSEGATTAVQGTLWGGIGTGAHRLHRNAGNIIHRVGTNGTEALIQVALDWALPHLIIATWEAATGTVGISIDGLPFTTATNASAVCAQTASAIGANSNDGTGVGWNGWVMMADVDTLSLRDPANVAKLNWWKQLVRDDFPSMSIA